MYEELPINITEEELIKWVVQKKKVNDEIYKDIRNRILNNLLFPNYENENLYRKYEELEILNCKIKEARNQKIKNEEITPKIIKEKTQEKNSLIDDMIGKLKNKNIKLQNKIRIEDIRSVVVKNNVRDIDTMITINNEYLIVLCNKNLSIFENLKKVQIMFKENNKIELQDILQLKEDLIKNDFLNNNVIFVVIDNENNLLETTKELDNINVNRVNRNVLLVTLTQFIEKNEGKEDKKPLLEILKVIKEKYEVKEKLDNKKLYEEIIKKGYIEVGEKFRKSYNCYNCFYLYLKMTKMYDFYEKRIYDELFYSQKAIANLKSKKFDIEVWIGDTISSNNWYNIIKDDEIIEVCNKELDEIKEFKEIYRYTFIRKKDNIYNEYIEFMGVYYLDIENTTNERRIWKKLDRYQVTTNIFELEKIIGETKGIVVVEEKKNKNVQDKKVKINTKVLNAK